MPAPEGRRGLGERGCEPAHADADLICDVRLVVDPDLGVLDALARLALAARRSGRRLVLRGVGGPLRELLELSGLDGLLSRAD